MTALTPTQVTEQLMKQFWQTGYAQTSVADLVAASHLSRSQFYRQYRNKSVTLRRSLQQYQVVLDQQLTQLIQRDHAMGTPLSVILADCLLIPAQSDQWPAGCLLVNMMAEIGDQDTLVADQTQAIYAALQTRFVGLLSPVATKLPATVAEVAASLMQVRSGLQLLAKQGLKSTQLKQQAVTAVDLLLAGV